MPISSTDTTGRVIQLPYLPTMSMGNYLRFVIAPAYGLQCVDDATVLAKVHTPDLRVVFNNECNHRLLKEFLSDNSDLVITPWNALDNSTNRSLTGNARIPSAKPK
jgi:hypothetical protein